jgi:RNA polymerase sigma factor for flagellar operon FliA
MNACGMYAVPSASPEEPFFKYTPFVKKIAYHLMGRLPSNVQIEDLIQAGMIGLMEAVRNYDADQGASFETYAGIRIRGAMLDEVRSGDWTPRSVHRKQRELAEAMRKVENRKGADARDHEVAKELGINLDEYHHILADAASARIYSLDAAADDEEDSYDHYIASQDEDPHQSLERTSFKDALVEAVKSLPQREALIMSLYYEEELNLREIGEIIGVSESRICQIHGEALLRLRAWMRNWLRSGGE